MTRGGSSVLSRRPRLDDVAARVGLSPASVSLVLRNAPGPSEATRQRVFQAAAELGYRADMTASLLARRRTNLLGTMLDVRNTFHAELVEHLHEAADAVGYDLVLSTVTRNRREDRAVETLLDFRCEALILLGPEVSRPATAGGRRRAADRRGHFGRRPFSGPCGSWAGGRPSRRARTPRHRLCRRRNWDDRRRSPPWVQDRHATTRPPRPGENRPRSPHGGVGDAGGPDIAERDAAYRSDHLQRPMRPRPARHLQPRRGSRPRHDVHRGL
jgi:transcriptional regulator with XRE-family HTH domain